MALFFSFIYDFLKKIVDMLWAVCQWLISVPGKISLFITTFFGVVFETLRFVGGHADELVTMFNSATNQVNQMASNVASANSETFGTLCYCLSIDRACAYVVSVVGIGLSFVSLVVIALLMYIITFWVTPMALIVVQKIFSVSTGGLVKT